MYGRRSRRAATRRAYLVTARARDGVGRILRRQDASQVDVLLVTEHGGLRTLQRRALHERAVATGIHQARGSVTRVVEAILVRVREAHGVGDLVARRSG